MTSVDLTRPCPGGASPGDVEFDDPGRGDGPDECPGCVAAGAVCDFHRWWTEGWDACAAFVARQVREERDAGGAR